MDLGPCAWMLEGSGHDERGEIWHSNGRGLAASMRVDHMLEGFLGRHEPRIFMKALDGFLDGFSGTEQAPKSC